MTIVDQRKLSFYTTEGLTDINATPSKDGPGYTVFLSRIIGNNEVHYILGRYKDEQDARYVLMLLYDAFLEDRDFEMPARDEIPDLRILKGKGRVTSMKVGHGGS